MEVVAVASSRERERGLLSEIGKLANRARDLRQRDAVSNHAQIKLLTDDLKVKWSELRALRAPPVSDDVSWGRRGSRD